MTLLFTASDWVPGLVTVTVSDMTQASASLLHSDCIANVPVDSVTSAPCGAPRSSSPTEHLLGDFPAGYRVAGIHPSRVAGWCPERLR